MVILVDALSLVNLCMSFLAHGCHGNIQFGLAVGFSFLVFFTATLFFCQVMFPSTLLGTGENWTLMKTISVTEYLNYEAGWPIIW